MVEVLGIKERNMIMKNSYTIKGLHTVGRYKIMQEINKNFEEESVDVYFVSDEEAVVKDKNGNQMKVLYRDKMVKILGVWNNKAEPSYVIFSVC